MTDIVERLRQYVENIRGGEDDPPEGYLCWQAADEIERLRAEIERLRHPKIIVGSRKLWEAMGKAISEAEMEGKER